MAGPHTRFYRDKANGKIMGVCAGLSDYFGIDVTMVRVAAVCIAVFTGLGPLPYFVMAWAAPVKKEDSEALGESDRNPTENKKFWQSVRKNPRRVARSVRGRLREIDRRLADAETYLTSPDRRLAREIESLR